jgi:hypothetical protein
MNASQWLDLATAVIDLLGGACGLVAAGVAVRRPPRRSGPGTPSSSGEPKSDA